MFSLTRDEYCALILSFLFCLHVYFTGQILKKIIVFIFENDSASEVNQSDALSLNDSIYFAIHDGIASFQACACSLENAVVRFTLGDTSNLAAIAIHGLLMLRYAWKDAYGSTCNPFIRYLNKRTDLRGLCVSWLFQLFGAFCSLRLSYFWWGLRLSTPHARLQTRRANIRRIACFRDSEGFHKLGDLQVPLLLGIFVETAVAFSDVILSATTSALLNLWKRLRHHRFQNDGEDFRMAEFVFFTLQQSTSIYIIYLGLPLTGAYMNGVNAVIQTWGLGRASNPLYHIIVYWFSPLLGLWAGKKTLEVIYALFKFWKCRLQIPVNDVLVSETAAESMENSPNANENCYLLRRNGLHSKSLSNNHLNEINLHRSSGYDILLRTRRKSHAASNDSSVVNCGSSDGGLRQRRHRSRTRNESVHL